MFENKSVDIAEEVENNSQHKSEIDPVVIKRADHPISRKNICPFAVKVLYKLKNAGYKAYLVGGGVRDLLLNKEPKDFDVSTDARPNQIKNLFKRNCWLIGRRFRLAHVKFGKTIIETSTFRSNPKPEQLKNNGNNKTTEETGKLIVRDDNNFGTPEEDALRRDFTINGLFYDISNFSIIDYVGGLEDLRTKTIRSIGDPEIRFQEDPVRMLRAIRFASRLGFKIDRKSSKAIKDYAAEIQHASMARLVEEVIKLFSFSSGEAAMRMMHKTGLMKYILPYLHDSLKKMDKSDFEKYFSYLHYLDKTYSGEKSIPPALIFSALIMPLGKNAMKKCEGRYIPADVIRNVTKEFCKDFIIPRRMRDAIRQTLLAVERIDAKTKRRGNRNRFMTKDYFPSALMLYSFMVDIEGVDTYKLEKWQESYTEFLSHSNHKKNDSGKHGETENNKNHSSSSSRKRKKKSKKKKTGINNSSSTQTESIEASTTIEKNVSEKRDETSIKKEKSTKDTDKKTASSISARKKTGKKKTQRKPQNPEIEKTEDAKTKSLKANKKQKSKSKASEKSKDANNEKKNPQEKSASNESGRRRHKRKIRSNINMVNDNRKSVLMSDGNTIHEESQPHWLDEI